MSRRIDRSLHTMLMLAINLHALGATYDAPMYIAQGTVKQIVGSTLKDVEERYSLGSLELLHERERLGVSCT